MTMGADGSSARQCGLADDLMMHASDSVRANAGKMGKMI
jgi:hypothetical protein